MVDSTSRAVRQALRRLAYRAFGLLPPRVRRGVVGVVAPSFTVGALAVLHDGDQVLFVTQLHRPGLALPGGLLKKGESARSALARELSEEIGLHAVDLADLADIPDTAHVDPGRTRIDLVFFLRADRAILALRPGSEVLSCSWRTVNDRELTPQTIEILAAVASRIPR